MSNMLRISTGAGAGGVAIAARLAKAGFEVTVFEKNHFTGGRCSLLHHEGYVRQNLYIGAGFLTPASASIKVPRSYCFQVFSRRLSTTLVPLWRLKEYS